MTSSKKQVREQRRQQASSRAKLRQIITAVLVVLGIAAIGILAALANRPPEPLASAEVIALGRQVFAQNCASCHGDEGQGHVLPDAPALDASEHAWHHSDGQIQRLLLSGGTTMPAFGDTLSAEEIEAVLRYIQTWWQADQLASQQSASEQDPFR